MDRHPRCPPWGCEWMSAPAVHGAPQIPDTLPQVCSGKAPIVTRARHPQTARQSQRTDVEPRPARWSAVLRGFREAAGASQEGWAAWLGWTDHPAALGIW